jgi:hypothetical protein
LQVELVILAFLVPARRVADLRASVKGFVLECRTTLPWILGNPIAVALGNSFLSVVLVVGAFVLTDRIAGVGTFAHEFVVVVRTPFVWFLCQTIAVFKIYISLKVVIVVFVSPAKQIANHLV